MRLSICVPSRRAYLEARYQEAVANVARLKNRRDKAQLKHVAAQAVVLQIKDEIEEYLQLMGGEQGPSGLTVVKNT